MTDNIFTMLDRIGARTKDTLERFMNDEELLQKYIRSFPEEPTMGKLRAAVAQRDFAAAEKAVHALKGIAKNLDFIPLADAAVDMLTELRDGNTDEALEDFDDVEREYNNFCTVIKKWRANNR